MVGLIVVGIALIAFFLLLLFALWKPGADQGKPGTAPDSHEGQQW